jgi:hypothetical protein
MGGGTRPGFAETAFGGGEHVGLVIGGVEVLAVPAGGEMVDSWGVESVACFAGDKGSLPMMPAGQGLVGKSGVS